MASYFIWTVGCQMNKADSERLAGTLESLGLSPAPAVDAADVVVVNSCSVRQTAEDRVVGKLGYLKGLHRKREVLVALTGCMVTGNDGELKARLPHVDIFMPPLQWGPLLTAVAERGLATNYELSEVAACRYEGRASAVPAAGQGSPSGAPRQLASVVGRGSPSGAPRQLASVVGRGWPTRWVPIIYGCDNFCTYCIVPYRRGREKSRPVAEVVAEVMALVEQGAREVTLLGQNVDSYGHDLPGRPDLADLLAQVNAVDGLCRIRFLTSHPKDMSDRLIDAVASLPKVCEHINLPVQAGDDRVLQAMRRGYTVADYRNLVDRIRARIPGVALSTDLIVGFPGETRAEFQHGYDLLAELRFDVVHAAMYSPRPGTVASRLPDDVPAEEKRERLRLVEEIQERIAFERNQALVDSEVEVLVERRSKGKWEGRTRGDKLVFFADAADWRGKLAVVRVERATAWSLQGQQITDSQVAKSGAAVL